MEDSKILKILYTFFLGILIALFVGVGINTFYIAPEEPKYPTITTTAKEPNTTEQAALDAKYNRAYDAFNEKFATYNRNVSIIAITAAVLLLAASIVYEKRIRFISDGIMLGGLFTLIYSIGRGLASGDSKYTFIMISVSLVVVLFLGYHRFVKPSEKTSKKRKSA